MSRGSQPAILPPKGAESNFQNHESRGYLFLIFGSLLLGLMFTFFAIRVYVKATTRTPKWNDLVCFLGVAFTTAYYGGLLHEVLKGNLGVHAWDVPLDALLNDKEIIAEMIFNIMLFLAFLSIKLTLLLLYLELFWPLRWLRLSVYVAGTVLIAFYIGNVIFIIVWMVPQGDESWTLHILTSEMSARWTNAGATVFTVFGAASDLFLFLLPLKPVASLQMSQQNKIRVFIPFLTGLLACVASASSIFFRLRDNESNDTTWTDLDLVLAIMAELCIGVIVSCMPSVSRFIKHMNTILHPKVEASNRRPVSDSGETVRYSKSFSKGSLDTPSTLQKPVNSDGDIESVQTDTNLLSQRLSLKLKESFSLQKEIIQVSARSSTPERRKPHSNLT